MKTLTRKEELIMLTIFNLKERAYLISIVDRLSELIGKKVSLTSVHLPLSRLEKRGMILGRLGEATAVRGGRRKKIYRITQAGFEVLDEHKKISDLIWSHYNEYSIHKD
jgi:PadR family transcriptional regulator PadR